MPDLRHIPLRQIQPSLVGLNWFVIMGEGLDAVVGDPWAFNCYPITELPQQIRGLVRIGAIRKISWWDAVS